MHRKEKKEEALSSVSSRAHKAYQLQSDSSPKGVQAGVRVTKAIFRAKDCGATIREIEEVDRAEHDYYNHRHN